MLMKDWQLLGQADTEEHQATLMPKEQTISLQLIQLQSCTSPGIPMYDTTISIIYKQRYMFAHCLEMYYSVLL